MSDTVANISLPTNQWIDLYALSGIPVGTKVNIANIGSSDIYVTVREAEPPVDYDAYRIINRENGLTFQNVAGDSGLWVFSNSTNGKVNITTDVAIVSVDIPNGIGAGINLDAWERQKVIHDYSLFHALFTYDIPNRLWEEFAVDVSDDYTVLPQTGTNVSSVLGELRITSGAVADNGAALLSKRHPRYRPNRGHLYSTACWMPDPNFNGTRKWGFMCGCLTDVRRSGVYFELEGNGSSHTLYAVLKSYGVTKHRVDLTDKLPSGFDVSKSALYDIQYQWRGVGSYKFYVNQELIHTIENLQLTSELSLWNPALSVGFEAITNTTTPVEMRFGCVDITSEGGNVDSRQFNMISTGDAVLNVDDTLTPVLAIKIPRVVDYNAVTVVNTRDVVLSEVVTWTRDEAGTYVYAARDIVVPNLDALTWDPVNDSPLLSLIGGNGSALETAFDLDVGNMQLVLQEWTEVDRKNRITNPEQDDVPFYVTAGDIIVVAVKSISGVGDTNTSTLYLSEEI